ncbi:phytoene/squalene synthase family protein [Frigoriflavimonas asaccharolytica]|uniref:Phytoene/squalene synthetase n=1 Tax=Frigoriflavimonas asaccharolytica TaxID=2735899 RepID=A0A8J8K7U7_9FLAO|nr:phytoene/squalene synthase family protein [Frigoriflavimonas asaccharolytica]NRS91876.1 phytoene/squalene synthetase [Frigoriflavimonas asaccharolytica]
MVQNLHNSVSFNCSKLVTQAYSSSFSRAILLFPTDIREGIYNIYGFVRFADEIVDSFHDYPKKELLDDFVLQLNDALAKGISLNPILHSFAYTVKKYNIERQYIDAFLDSMYKDLEDIKYETVEQYEEYIYGSAEVVGLMCLKVFVNADPKRYEELEPYAKSLGAAFQKINFLRDIRADFHVLNRTYFPKVDFQKFSLRDKQEIELDIAKDFENALIGIKLLPVTSKFAVYMAYKYYINLFKKIRNTEPEILLSKRIRVSNARKAYLLGEMILNKNLKLV